MTEWTNCFPNYKMQHCATAGPWTPSWICALSSTSTSMNGWVQGWGSQRRNKTPQANWILEDRIPLDSEQKMLSVTWEEAKGQVCVCAPWLRCLQLPPNPSCPREEHRPPAGWAKALEVLPSPQCFGSSPRPNFNLPPWRTYVEQAYLFRLWMSP